MLLSRLAKGFLNCPVQMLVRCFTGLVDSIQLSLCRLFQVSIDSARSHRAVSVTSWVWALAVVPIFSLASIYAISTVHAACYLGAAGYIAVALAAWVVTLYCKVFVDHF
jgi:hypothetical protein